MCIQYLFQTNKKHTDRFHRDFKTDHLFLSESVYILLKNLVAKSTAVPHWSSRLWDRPLGGNRCTAINFYMRISFDMCVFVRPWFMRAIVIVEVGEFHSLYMVIFKSFTYCENKIFL